MNTNRPTNAPPTVPPYGVLADLYAQRALHGTPYSALPDAPVLPYVEPRRQLRRGVAALKSALRRLPSVRIARRRHVECTPS